MKNAIASRLIGFRSTSLRVHVLREQGEYVWVRTADLLDAGTALVLDRSQVQPEAADAVIQHKAGLVAFA